MLKTIFMNLLGFTMFKWLKSLAHCCKFELNSSSLRFGSELNESIRSEIVTSREIQYIMDWTLNS
jgi:hypothetical protein